MVRLNQIIAVTNGKKGQAQKDLTGTYHRLQKEHLFSGIARTYCPKDDEGERLPAERSLVQCKVKDELAKAVTSLTDLFDAVATQDFGNCDCGADVVVDDITILKRVPVTFLLFLEKQLIDVRTLIEKLPTLDPTETWAYSNDQDCYATAPIETTRTKKVPYRFVKYEATKEHPAQVAVLTEDVIAGHWSTTKYSGAVSVKERNEMLDRVRKLQDAVTFAREEANSAEVPQKSVGAAVFTYLFGDNA